MDEMVTLVLTAASWAIAGFCITVLLMRARDTPAQLPLAVIFAALCFASGGPLLRVFAPAWETAFYELSLPAYLSMGPALWLYVKGLTHEVRWAPSRADWPHAVPVALCLCLIILDINVPEFPDSQSLWRTTYIAGVAIAWGVTAILWLWQCVHITRRLIRRLAIHRQRLRAELSNTDGRELKGAEAVAAAIALLWLLSLAVVIFRNVMRLSVLPDAAIAAAFVALTAALGLWGLKQQPGSGNHRTSQEGTVTSEADTTDQAPAKYRKSALTDVQAERIAARLKTAMSTERLYLDPALSLSRLANHLRISPNHISQTLNSVMGQSFFDYVNACRVEAAKADVEAGEKAILDIAFDHGFNARSSFYRAFRRETGMTPTDWRDRAINSRELISG